MFIGHTILAFAIAVSGPIGALVMSEFVLDIAAWALRMQAALTQYGATDTLNDLLFDCIGGLVVAGNQ